MMIVKIQIMHHEGIALHLALTELECISDWLTALSLERMRAVLYHLLAYHCHLQDVASALKRDDEKKLLVQLQNHMQIAFNLTMNSTLFVDAFFQCIDTFQDCLEWSQSWKLNEVYQK